MAEEPTARLQETIEERLIQLEKLMDQKKRADTIVSQLASSSRKSSGSTIIVLSVALAAPLTTAVHGCVQLKLAEQAQEHKLRLEAEAQEHRMAQEVWSAFVKAAEGDHAVDEMSVRNRRRLLRFLAKTASDADIRAWASAELASNELNTVRTLEKERRADRLQDMVTDITARNGTCKGTCKELDHEVKRIRAVIKKNVDDPLKDL